MALKKFTPSKQQKAVFDWGIKGKGHLNLVARTGTGKTTTLLELCKHLTGSIILCAFNKNIADELQRRMTAMKLKAAQAGTFHSVGLRAWRKVHPAVQVDSNKVFDLIGQNLPPVQIKKFGTFIRKAVSLAKQSGFGHLCDINDMDAWNEIIEHFDLMDDLENGNGYNPTELIYTCIGVYNQSLAMDNDIVDFDDMLLAPLLRKVAMPQYDWVLADELQDTNAIRRALVIKMLRPKTGRFVGVGDERQAIYGFSGADSDAMDLVKEALGCKELPLNVTYRCPKSVVALAQTWVPDITAHETAPEGIVREVNLVAAGTELCSDCSGTGKIKEVDRVVPCKTCDGKCVLPGKGKTFWDEKLTKDDVILCRLTRPIIEMAYQLLRKGIACRVEGRDIGQGLIKLCNKWKLADLNALLQRLELYLQSETLKWRQKGKEEKVAAVQDKVDTINILAEKLQSEGKHMISDLVNFINQLFGDTPEGTKPSVLTLSTIHKAKGKEWDRVFILGRKALQPCKWARMDWEKRAEENLMYVAVTRAKKELIDINI